MNKQMGGRKLGMLYGLEFTSYSFGLKSSSHLLRSAVAFLCLATNFECMLRSKCRHDMNSLNDTVHYYAVADAELIYFFKRLSGWSEAAAPVVLIAATAAAVACFRY